jgi:DUF4097 and DUF4098 domain-containing protein YvlB
MSDGRTRYGSIFSGTVLILVGAVLLVHAYHPDFEFWRPYAQWWPLLLIFWGLVKLWERMSARRGGDPGPAGRVTGGEIALVVGVLLLLGIIGGADWFRTHRGNVDLNDIGFFRGTPYTFTEVVPAKTVPAKSSVSVTWGRGDINILADDTAELRVTEKKTAYASGQAEAESAAGQVHAVVVDKGNGNYEVRPNNESVRNRVETSLELHVPKLAGISTTTDSGDVRITGANGNISVVTRNGDIAVRDAGGNVLVTSSHGDVQVAGVAGDVKIAGRGGEVEVGDIQGQVAVEGEFFGPIRMNHVTKGVRFVSSKTDLTITQLSGQLKGGSGNWEISNSNGDLTLSTRKSDVSIQDAGGRLQISDDGGDVELHFSQPPRADISVESRSGDLSLSMPPQSSFQLDAQTQNGDLDCAFPGLISVGKPDGDNQGLQGQVGNRGPAIHLRTQHGDIRISKK